MTGLYNLKKYFIHYLKNQDHKAQMYHCQTPGSRTHLMLCSKIIEIFMNDNTIFKIIENCKTWFLITRLFKASPKSEQTSNKILHN